MNPIETYHRWKNIPDPRLARELAEIEKDPRQIVERFGTPLSFGTGGLRGLMGAGENRMNIYTVARATQGYARYLRSRFSQPAVAIAYDSRLLSQDFAQTAAQVLAANGIQAYLFSEIMPTPILSFTVRRLGLSGGIVITASHNPAPYNGYKIYGPDGGQITQEAARDIKAQIDEVDLLRGIRRVSLEQGKADGRIAFLGREVTDAYLDAVLSQSLLPPQRGRGVPIVYSPLHGAGFSWVTQALGRAGFDQVTVVPSQAGPDGNFPTCPKPNPEEAQAMEEGIRWARKLGADLVIATDPDCDRVGAAVRQGADFLLLSGNQVGALLLDFLCRRRQEMGAMPERPVAMKTIVTTEMAQAICDGYGVRLQNVLTGFKYIGEQLSLLEGRGEEERFLFGMEESCGYLTGTAVRDKDGVLGSLLICQMFCDYRGRGMTLMDGLAELSARFGAFVDTQQTMAFEGAEGAGQMERLMDALRQNPPDILCGRRILWSVDYKAGVRRTAAGEKSPTGLPSSNVMRFCYEGGVTITVRPSGTEPKLKIYYSLRGDTLAEAQALEAQCRAAFGNILSDLRSA